MDNLSLTSKYYRALCEPHLYRELTFSRRNSYLINCLFLTILSRPELALHIQSVVLNDGEEGDQGFDSSTYEWLLDQVINVRELVRKVAAPLQDVEFTLQWFGEMYQGLPTSSQATLALVLCLATNLVYLDLGGETASGMLRKVLGQRWMTDDETSYPFCKLKTLCLQNGVRGCLLPGLEEMHLRRVNGSIDGPLFSKYSIEELGSNLRVLTLCSINFSPQWMEGAVEWKIFKGMKELVVQFAGSTDGWDSPWSNYDMGRMSNAIVTSLLELEVLE